MALLKLFIELGKGALFHYYNNSLRRFVKTDDKSAIGMSGHIDVHPHVLIFEDEVKSTGIKTNNQKGE